MKRTISLLLAVLLALVLVACGGQEPQQPEAQQKRESTTSKAKDDGEQVAEISTEGWQETTFYTIAYLYPAVATYDSTDDEYDYVYFGTNSFLMLYNTQEDESLVNASDVADIAEIMQSGYQNMFESLDFSTVQATTVGGTPAYRFDAEMLGGDGEPFIGDYQFECVVFAVGGNAYTAAYISPAQSYSKYYDVYRRVLETVSPVEEGPTDDTPPDTTSAQEPSKQEPPEPPAKTEWKTSGMYKVGTDIPAGEYYLENTSSLFAYMAVCKDADGTFSSIIVNENFSGNLYVTVDEGQYLELSGGKLALAETVTKNFDEYNLGDGMYRVGEDIPAGEYKLENTSSLFGYVCVYKNSYLGVSNISTNDNFENNKYIKVSEGQYLYLSGCSGALQA